MNTALPFVSVCLLTYKRAEVLSRSLDSLLVQTHRDFELIINDDNSPDDTQRVGRDYERRDSRVRYCRNERNLRYAGNQNAALRRARSDYVAIVHDGDVYRPDLLEQWTTALVRHPSAAIVFNALEAMDDSGRVVRVHRLPFPPLIQGQELFDNMITRLDSPIFGIVMVRKACIENVGPFDTRFPVLADVDMWLRLLLHYDAAYVDEPLLRVAPRELDHVNREVNWSILTENEQIHRINADRRYIDDPSGRQQVHRVLDRAFLYWRLRTLVLCVKPRRWGKIPSGIRSLVSGRATV